MDKFKEKYRIESNRLKDWNYASNGMYFLTIVVANRECILGNIENDEMILSDFGKIVETEWFRSFEIRNELFLDEFIIMPNHLHTIVFIDNPKMDSRTDGSHVDGSHVVETHGRASLRDNVATNDNAATNTNKPHLYRQPKSISSFMAGFKSSVNSKIDDYIDDNKLNIPKYNRNNHFFQPNYHDHIIRNDESYEHIKNYIINNPKKWDDDKFNNNIT